MPCSHEKAGAMLQALLNARFDIENMTDLTGIRREDVIKMIHEHQADLIREIKNPPVMDRGKMYRSLLDQGYYVDHIAELTGANVVDITAAVREHALQLRREASKARRESYAAIKRDMEHISSLTPAEIHNLANQIRLAINITPTLTLKEHGASLNRTEHWAVRILNLSKIIRKDT